MSVLSTWFTSGAVGTAANFNRDAVIDTALISLPLLKGLPVKSLAVFEGALHALISQRFQ